MDLVPTDTLPALVADRENRLEMHPLWQGSRSFAREEAYTDWTADRSFHVLYLVVAGEVQLEDEGGTQALGPGSGALVAPRRWRRMAIRAGTTLAETWFLPHRGDRPCAGRRALVIAAETADLVPLVDRLARLAAGEEADGPAVRHLLAHIVACLLADPGRPGVRGLTANRRRELVAWTRQHIAHGPTVADLARVVGLSADHFARSFRAAFGLPPRTWLMRERIREACWRLRAGDAPVARIAADLGYESTAHFCRQFGKVVGTTPGRYRG